MRKNLFVLAITFLMATIDMSAQNYDESKVPNYTLPDLLVSLEKRKIANINDWEYLRRKEVIYYFGNDIYGKMPKDYDSINFELINADFGVMQGKANRKQVRIDIYRKEQKASLNLLLFIPSKVSSPPPVMLLINNRDESNTDPERKKRSEFWPAETVIDSGFAIASFNVNDAAPDDAEHFKEGILKLYPELTARPDGVKAISAWAYAASRVMDYFETDKDVDSKKVAVIGHSRGGKASLWAGANDQRFAAVISNCSGNSGAAISRRMFGETVADINARFPWWFNDNYKKYNNDVNKLPVDQHMLLALIAPRPLYVTNATRDLWADPTGTYLALKFALPVYDLYQRKSSLSPSMPPPDSPIIESITGYHNRTGEHDLTQYDWTQFIRFLKYHFIR